MVDEKRSAEIHCYSKMKTWLRGCVSMRERNVVDGCTNKKCVLKLVGCDETTYGQIFYIFFLINSKFDQMDIRGVY